VDQAVAWQASHFPNFRPVWGKGVILSAMTNLQQYIESYFGVVNPNSLETISSLFRRMSLAKGHYFLKTGRYCDKLGFVRSGLLRIFADTERKEVTQWISTQGYFVTDLSSFIFQAPARWNIQAMTDTEIYVIDQHDYKNIKNIVPQWLELEKLFLTKCFIMMEDRIFGLLSLSAEERYHLLFEQHSELFNQVPLRYLASMLGMTPETFSRIRNKHAKKNS
jgi:CRP-like cAMP-binding protein